MPVRRGDVDDAARAPGGHHSQLVLHAQQRAEHVGVEGRRIALGGLVDHWAGLALRAGTVDRDVESPEALDRLIDEMAHLVFAPDVGLDEGGLRAERAELGFERLAFDFAAAGSDDGGAVLGKGKSGGAADAGQRASDKDDGSGHCRCPFKSAIPAGGV
jgi:hypothetical protein